MDGALRLRSGLIWAGILAMALGPLVAVVESAAVGTGTWAYRVPISVARLSPVVWAAGLVLVLSRGALRATPRSRTAVLVLGAVLVLLGLGHGIVLPGLYAELPDPAFRPFFVGGGVRVVVALVVTGLLCILAARRLPVAGR
jgi:hypothetical protein